MDEDAVNTADDQAIEPPEEIENFDLSAPEGEAAFIDDEGDQAEAPDSSEGTETEGEEDTDQSTEQTEPDSDQTEATDEMSEKERNAYYAQQRIAAKRQSDKFMADLRQQAKESYVDKIDQEEYEDMDETQAAKLQELEQFRREMTLERELEKVERVRESTAMSFTQAEQSIPIFNPSHPEYKAELHEDAIADWSAAYLEIAMDADGNPQVIGVKDGAPSPHDYLSQKAERYQSVLKMAAARGQANAQRNRAGAEVPSSSSTRGSGDSIEALEERVGDIPLA